MHSKNYAIKMGTISDWTDGSVKTYSSEFQTVKKFSSYWKNVLQNAHAVKNDSKQRKVIQCRCNGPSTKDECCLLEVRELEGTYFLAKKKHTGMQHKDDCRFFQVDWETSGLKAYDRDIVDDDGGIKVGLGLQMRDEEGQVVLPASSKLTRNESYAKKRKQVSLLGLLQILWNTAGLNYCKPDSIMQRSNIPYRLSQQAIPLKIKHLSLAEHLLIYQMGNNNQKVLKFAVKNKRRLFVIALLAPWVSSEKSEGSVLPIDSLDGIPELYLPAERWATTCHSFERAVRAWKSGKKTVAIAQIEPRQASIGVGYECCVVGLALMRVTDYWLPVESDYEHTVADELVDDGRRFIKPLRYDADEEEVFPDFILLDTDHPRGTPMEVFGMNSTEYRARQAVKVDYYNDVFGVTGWWSWIPSVEPTHQPFPPKAA